MKKTILGAGLLVLGLASCSSLNSGDAQKLAFFSADAAVTGNQIYQTSKQLVDVAKTKNIDSILFYAGQLEPLVVKEFQDKDSIAYYTKKISGKDTAQ